MNNYPLDNLGDASPAMAELRTLLGGLKDHATLNLEIIELKALLAEVKAEAMDEQCRADDAEALVRELREELRVEKARRRFEYAPVDAQLVDACRDLEPRQIKNLFAYALTGLTACTAVEHTQWLMERFRDACLAVSESVEVEEVA